MLNNYTDAELLHEINRRLGNVPQSAQKVCTITPYDIMMKMIEKGWKENPKQGESDPRIDKMWKYVGFPTLTDDDSYCAGTLNACLKLAGYEMSDAVPTARSFETYGKQVATSTVRQGDIAVFESTTSSWKGHVGFVKSVNRMIIAVAGGNQGNEMRVSNYAWQSPILKLKCFRRVTDMNKVGEPDWKTLKEWDLL